MKSDDRFGLRPLWDSLLEIYKAFEVVCLKHGLRCYATDGTALGAIRHKGFIPWDDDFDVSMPRPDYEKFRAFAASELPPHLRFIDCRNTSSFTMLFGKIQDSRKNHVAEVEAKIGHSLPGGIGIDIFPIEGCPATLLKRNAIRLANFLLTRAMVFRNMKLDTSSPRGMAYFLFGKFAKVLAPRLKTDADYIRALERLSLATDFESNSFTCRTCSQRNLFRRVPLPKSVWGKPMAVEFEETTILVPEDCDAYLRNEFDKHDYKELPPPEQQHPTHASGGNFSWRFG